MDKTMEVYFPSSVLKDYIMRAVGIWSGGARVCYVDVTVSEDSDEPTAVVGVQTKAGESLSISLSHELIRLALAVPYAQGNSPLDTDSVSFNHDKRLGFGLVTATAVRFTERPAAHQSSEAGLFPLPVGINILQDQLDELVHRLVEKRQGPNHNRGMLYSYDKVKDAATVAIFTGSKMEEVVISGADLRAALAEKLNDRGYDVEAGDIEIVHRGSMCAPKTVAHVKTRRLSTN